MAAVRAALPGYARLRHPAFRWLLLILLSLGTAALLEGAKLSAARLLGPMFAAIFIAVCNARLTVPSRSFIFAQAIIGLMIAHSMPVTLAAELLHAWPMFISTVTSVVVASASLGWLLARWKVLPGTTAVWGSLPGAASAMALMAEAFGADVRLVAFMQYARVLLVALGASLVSHFWIAHSAASVAASTGFAEFGWLPFFETIALAASGAWLGLRLRIPAGAILLPMALGLILQDTGLLQITLPPWLLAFSYAMVGWGIGLRFTRDILRHVLRALPRVLLSISALMVICGLIALLLVRFAHVDTLTAYLATSPGGADSIAIIAASSKVDVPFVMAMQTSRFLLVLLAGPALARFVARRVTADDQ